MIRKMLWYYKKKNSLLFVVTVMVTMFLFNLLSTYCSVQEMLVADVTQTEGSWNLCVKDLSKDKINICETSDVVDEAGIEIVKEENMVSFQGREMASVELDLHYMDKSAMHLNALKLYKGKLPEKKDEIVISAGMKLDGEYAYKGNYIGKKIKMENSSIEYQVVGILDNLDASTENKNNECIVLADEEFQEATTYVKLKDNRLNFWGSNDKVRKHSYELVTMLGFQKTDVYDWQQIREENLSGDMEEYAVLFNNDLLTVLEMGNTQTTTQTIQIVILLFGTIILLVGSFMIASVSISDYQNRRSDHAVFLLCGSELSAVKKQFIAEKEIIFGTGSLAGIFCGWILQQVIVKLVQSYRTTALVNLNISFSVYIALFTVCLVLVISFLTEIIAFKKLGKLSPLEALYGKREHTEKQTRMLSKLEIGTSSVPVEFHLGLINVTRKKLSSVINLLCIGTAVFLFICFYDFGSVTNQIVSEQEEENQFQFFAYANEIEHLDKLKKQIPYVENLEIVYDSTILMEQKNKEGVLSEDSVKWYSDIYENRQDSVYLDVVAIDRSYYENYLQGKEKTDYDTLINENACVYDDGCLVSKKNKVIQILDDLENYNITFTSEDLIENTGTSEILLKSPVNRYQIPLEDNFQPTLYVPYEVYFDKFTPSFVMLNLNAVSGHEDEVKTWLLEHSEEYGISVQDNVLEYFEVRDTVSMVQIVLGGILVLVALVAILYMVSALKNSIDSQKKELDVLQALGMEKKQIFYIVFCESLFYVIGGLLIGSLLSAMITKRFVEIMANVTILSLSIPVYPLFLCAVLCAMVSFVICFFVVKRYFNGFEFLNLKS